MSKVKIVLNRQGVAELMKSPEMMEICRDHADAALASLGDGYEVTIVLAVVFGNRFSGSVPNV